MLNILYVEDDARSRDVLHMVHRMNPGLMALTMFEDSANFEERLLKLAPQPDAVLLDIHVLPYTGLEMLAMIRRRAEYDSTPVIALTASVMNEEVEMLKGVGFQGVISKPIDLDTFPEILERVMQGEKIWYVW